MRRISRDDVRLRIAIGLTVQPKHLKKAFGLDVERMREMVADDIARRIMGSPESEAVILVPSLTGSSHSPRHGIWGVDEPHPFPDVT